MVGVLVDIKLTILRHSLTGSRKALMGIGGAGGLALAACTVLLCMGQNASAGSINVLCTLFLIWSIGWLLGPMLTGGDTALMPDFFRTLPRPTNELAVGLLAATFVGLPPLVTAVALLGLPLYAAGFGVLSFAVAIPAAALQLVAIVLLARVVGRVIAYSMQSRIGMELGAIAPAFFIAFISIGWFAVPAIANAVNSQSPVYSTLVRASPSGWGVDAVHATQQGDWLLASASLAGLAGFSALLFVVWTRLLMNGATAVGVATHRRWSPRLTPNSPSGAAMTKELLTWWRDPARGRFLRMGTWVGVSFGVLTALDGAGVVLPWIGPFTIVCMVALAGNVYGFDGSALWITLTTPGGATADVRGRQLAWLLIAAPLTIALTIVWDALSGQMWSWRVTAALLPALLGTGAGVLVLASLLKLVPAGDPANRSRSVMVAGGDLHLGELQVEGLLSAGLLLIAAAPVLALTLVADAIQSAPLEGIAIVAGIGSGAFFGWWFGWVACKRLESQGPELLLLMTRSGSGSAKNRSKRSTTI